jgi:aspartate ammonia-lyase
MPAGKPRVHKPDCQCIVCRRKRAKAERERLKMEEKKLEAAVAAGGVTIGSLAIGAKFKYQNNVYQKLNEVTGGSVITDLTTVGETTTRVIPNQTIVELFKRTHVEDSMD